MLCFVNSANTLFMVALHSPRSPRIYYIIPRFFFFFFCKNKFSKKCSSIWLECFDPLLLCHFFLKLVTTTKIFYELFFLDKCFHFTLLLNPWDVVWVLQRSRSSRTTFLHSGYVWFCEDGVEGLSRGVFRAGDTVTVSQGELPGIRFTLPCPLLEHKIIQIFSYEKYLLFPSWRKIIGEVFLKWHCHNIDTNSFRTYPKMIREGFNKQKRQIIHLSWICF